MLNNAEKFNHKGRTGFAQGSLQQLCELNKVNCKHNKKILFVLCGKITLRLNIF
jgi:hypothetical protein